MKSATYSKVMGAAKITEVAANNAKVAMVR
jgi:hypothetical protein